MKTLSGTDADRVRTQLYLRNVSSSHTFLPPSASGSGMAPLPEPLRQEGETVAFHRQGWGAGALGGWLQGWDPTLVWGRGQGLGFRVRAPPPRDSTLPY